MLSGGGIAMSEVNAGRQSVCRVPLQCLLSIFFTFNRLADFCLAFLGPHHGVLRFHLAFDDTTARLHHYYRRFF